MKAIMHPEHCLGRVARSVVLLLITPLLACGSRVTGAGAGGIAVPTSMNVYRGQDCFAAGCHNNGSPTLGGGGTVYLSPTTSVGAELVAVTLTPDNGDPPVLTYSNSAGNFAWKAGSTRAGVNYTASMALGTATPKQMTAPVTSPASCNSCHSFSGSAGSHLSIQ